MKLNRYSMKKVFQKKQMADECSERNDKLFKELAKY